MCAVGVAWLLMGCSEPEPTCANFFGDPAQPIEMAIGHRAQGGSFVSLTEGDPIDLVRPIQGGHVLFIAARARNLCLDDVRLDAKVFDEGGGTTFQGDRFQANNARIEVGHARDSSRALGLSVYDHRVTFLERVSGFFDVDETGADLSGEHELGPTFRLDWELAYSRSHLSRPETPDFDAEDRTEIEESWKLGGVWLLSQGSFLQIKAGWQNNKTRSLAPSTLRALTGSLSYRRGVPAGAQLSVDLARDIYPAIYEDNNVYVTNRLTVMLTNDPRARLSLGGRASYWTNEFPVPDSVGRVREDRTLDADAWVGYRLGRWAVGRLYVRKGHRSSAVPGFDYDVNTVGATIGFGS